MQRTIALLIPAFPLLLWLYCSTPNNPFEDYSNCTITITRPGQTDTVCLVYDTVAVTIRIDGASLFKVLTLYIGSKDSTTLSSFENNWTQDLEIKKVFQLPDTVMIIAKAVLQDNSQLLESRRIFIAGRAPVITLEPPDSLAFEIGALCTVSVMATGIPALSYKWMKNGSPRPGDTAPRLHIDNFQAADTGIYRCIVSNAWGSDTSLPMRLTVKKQTGKTIYWDFAFFRDTVDEGDSVAIRLDSLFTAPGADTVSIGMPDTIKQAGILGDSLFIFSAGARDSGTYEIPVTVSSRSGADTARIVITVLPRYHTLTLVADSGSITVQPAVERYRWNDTVALKAVPNSGFVFVQWSGDAGGVADSISLVILRDITVRAVFALKDSSACIQINTGSLNQAIRTISPGAARPKSICPAQGAYDQGTIRIWGTVRFVVQ